MMMFTYRRASERIKAMDECLTFGGPVTDDAWDACCLYGDLQDLEKCIMLGADINAFMPHRDMQALAMFTGWHRSCHRIVLEKSKLLIQHGANIHARVQCSATDTCSLIEMTEYVGNLELRDLYVRLLSERESSGSLKLLE